MQATNHPKPGIYEHYKGGRYLVLSTAKHTETEEYLVVYKTLYGDQSLWVRPLSMFIEKIEKDGQWVQRFKLIEEQDPII